MNKESPEGLGRDFQLALGNLRAIVQDRIIHLIDTDKSQSTGVLIDFLQVLIILVYQTLIVI